MKRLVVFLAIYFLFLSASFALTVADDANNKITLDKSTTRVITLAPDLTEIVFAMGAGSKIIATVSASDYPKAARLLPSIGSYSGLDLERIIALKPDLILAWGGTFQRQLAILKKFHIPIYINQPKHISDVPRAIKNIGYLMGFQNTADQLALQFSNQLEELKQHYAHKKTVPVFYQIGNSFFTINHESWINDLITLCGGKNIFADLGTIAPEVTAEAIFVANPAVILASSNNDEWQTYWQQFKTMSAVREKRLVTVTPDLVERAGPRLIAGALQICEGIAAGGSSGKSRE